MHNAVMLNYHVIISFVNWPIYLGAQSVVVQCKSVQTVDLPKPYRSTKLFSLFNTSYVLLDIELYFISPSPYNGLYTLNPFVSLDGFQKKVSFVRVSNSTTSICTRHKDETATTNLSLSLSLFLKPNVQQAIVLSTKT